MYPKPYSIYLRGTIIRSVLTIDITTIIMIDTMFTVVNTTTLESVGAA